ncbi:MAG TPA: DoxX family protein [Candidatus Limnocylindrales bacterium]
MNTALWIAQIMLAVAFAGAGVMKLTQPKEKLQPRMAYVEDFSAGTIKLIGAAELAGAIGVILPWALGIAEILTPVAATGLVIVMAAAIVVHLRRKEPQALPINIVLGGLALFVALGRF